MINPIIISPLLEVPQFVIRYVECIEYIAFDTQQKSKIVIMTSQIMYTFFPATLWRNSQEIGGSSETW